MTQTLYLHWTATPYDWIRPGQYHSIISGNGRVHRLHDYNVDLPAHTYGRNRVALSCACMGGVPDPWTCLLYTSPSPRDPKTSRMPSSA